MNKLTTTQFVGFGMWGSMFASLNHGLGQSLDVLDDTEISLAQKVRRKLLPLILRKYKCTLTPLAVILCKPNHILYRTRLVEMFYSYSHPGRLQAEFYGLICDKRHYSCCCGMGSSWRSCSICWLFTRCHHTKIRW